MLAVVAPAVALPYPSLSLCFCSACCVLRFDTCQITLLPQSTRPPQPSWRAADPKQRSKRWWLQLRMAVRMGSFVAGFVEGSREEREKKDLALQEEKEAEEAKQALKVEMAEAEEAEAHAADAERVARDELNLLEKEQNDVDSARVQLEKAQADREAAVAAKAAAENAVENPAVSFVLFRLANIKNADKVSTALLPSPPRTQSPQPALNSAAAPSTLTGHM